MPPEIFALDLATRTGWARGRVGQQPTWGSIRFGKDNDTNNAVFGKAMKWLAEVLQPEPRPDTVILEALLPPTAKIPTGKTSRAAIERLAGLTAIARGVCYLRNIGEISEAKVVDIRAHFIGDRATKRPEAKRLTIERCHRLGWLCSDDNQADALALWSFACALVDPQSAMNVVPLFNKRLAG